MRRRAYGNILGVALFCVSVTALAQAPAPSITVTGSIAKPITLTAADLAQMPRATATTSNGGVETKYEGVWMHEILQKAGLELGEALRGKALTTYVLAEAQDGYQVVFSIGELDPAMTDAQILVRQGGRQAAVRKQRCVSTCRGSRQARRPVRSNAD